MRVRVSSTVVYFESKLVLLSPSSSLPVAPFPLLLLLSHSVE